MRYVATVIIVLITGMLVLSELGISIAPILASAGIVGIAVGFGAQSLIKDYFTGLFLLVENQLRVGDLVEVAGKAGVVEELTLRYIRLRDYEGSVHFIPSGAVVTVTTRSRNFRMPWRTSASPTARTWKRCSRSCARWPPGCARTTPSAR